MNVPPTCSTCRWWGWESEQQDEKRSCLMMFVQPDKTKADDSCTKHKPKEPEEER